MCEPEPQKTSGWRGWSDLPAPHVASATGPWIDLSHCITENLSRIPFFPQPVIRQISTSPIRLTQIQWVVHHGTHLDAPCHFISDGPAMDAIPLDRFYGSGVIWRFDTQDCAAIDARDLERATPRMRPGDIVLIDTGWWHHINTDRYEDHPYLTGEAAEWLVAQGAKIVGIDASSPDQAGHYRPKEFTFPVHHTLLSNGVLIAEHLTNLSPLAGRRVEIMFLGINIAGSDGAPARPIARPVD